jgi:hypothetical protein
VLVQLADRAPRAFGITHLDKRESARLTGRAIANEVDCANATRTLEERLQGSLCGVVWQVADVKFGTHEHLLHLSTMRVNLMAGSSGMLGDKTQERRRARI